MKYPDYVQHIANHITTGIVVDTNDPQEMGRVRVYCPSLGDLPNTHIEDLPWCRYITPFGGVLNDSGITRGSSHNSGTANGQVSYGFWAIPKCGATAVVMCVDGNPNVRLWCGCLHVPGMTHTLPNGRWGGEDGKKGGPLTSTDEPIQPLYDNYKKAFGSNNPIFNTRAADMQVSALTEKQARAVENNVKRDDADEKRPGYGSSRINPDLKYKFVDKNRDSHVYSWTTPGFHSITMNDRQDWSRMRFRSSTGHQIILDDTHDVIYINTAIGNNWIELHSNGNIEIFSANKVSVHAENDINFTTNKTFRLHASEGIHMRTDGDFRLYAADSINLKTQDNIKIAAADSVFIDAVGGEVDVKAGDENRFTSGGNTHILAGGEIIETGSRIHLNGPGAAPASAANPSSAAFPNRVPMHEPWPRSDSKDDNTIEPKYNSFDDESTW